MAIPPPQIQTYHCLCSSLLLASTHKLSALPTRSPTTGGLDSALILPLPPAPPSLSDNIDLPEAGYTLLFGTTTDRKITLVRREDGFEKRVLHRCSRCRLVVGYELRKAMTRDGEAMELESNGIVDKGKGKEGYTGKVLYIFPAGIMSTDFMMVQTALGRQQMGEDDVDIKRGGLAIFE